VPDAPDHPPLQINFWTPHAWYSAVIHVDRVVPLLRERAATLGLPWRITFGGNLPDTAVDWLLYLKAVPPPGVCPVERAVIGFTGGGGTEHMMDGETALVAPDGDVPALSQALRRVLEDDALRGKLRRGGLAKAGEFAIERMRWELATFARRAIDEALPTTPAGRDRSRVR
jgi:hypothetical protein